MNKQYFSCDNLMNSIKVHDSLDEAKDNASTAIEDIMSELADNPYSDDEYKIDCVCYGVVLGRYEKVTREPTDEECERHYELYQDFLDYVVEPTKLVEHPQNNGWIKCGEQLPKIEQDVLVTDGCVVQIATYMGIDYEPVGDYVPHAEVPVFEDFDGNWLCDITHWHPLPLMPKH